MAIVFHCEHCGREIRAVDTAGGKWGKCPSCHNKVYVPSVETEEEEELKLAPIDQEAEERERQLKAETYRLTQDILMERDIPENLTTTSLPVQNADEGELRKKVITYLKQMAKGNLSEADRVLAMIAPHRAKVLTIIDRIALSEITEKDLTGISPQVLSGMIRTLRSRIDRK